MKRSYIEKLFSYCTVFVATMLLAGNAIAQEETAEEKAAKEAATKAAMEKLAPLEEAIKAAKAKEEDYAFEGSTEEADALFEAATTEGVEFSEDASVVLADQVFPASSGYTVWLIHNLWILIAAALVFLMHLGFATLESGLTQQKNTINILFKNVFIICIGILTYYWTGFNTHYPGDSWIIPGWLSLNGPAGFGDADKFAMMTAAYHGSYPWWTDFIFQAMFAATGATIVSGAVAERIKLTSFMIYAAILVAFAYPIIGAWHWGGGWLTALPDGFYDFAGSSVVHAFGGFAALAAVIVLGARKGKYTSSGIKPILGHSMPLAAISVFLLWLGWFGFNGGSVLSADGASVALVFTTTALAAAGGGIAAIVTAWIALRKPDLSMALNGILAGLVGITAGADAISTTMSIVVGMIAGVIVVFSIVIFDKIKIDDPVGAISVHGVCGIWGTLAVGLFGGANLMTQLIGTLAVSAAAFVFSFVLMLILKVTIGVRVSEEEEIAGLDVEEHGSPAYGDFAVHGSSLQG